MFNMGKDLEGENSVKCLINVAISGDDLYLNKYYANYKCYLKILKHW